jgi:4'-phosphopantetheinyl transferase
MNIVTPAFCVPPALPWSLGEAEVHVWLANLDRSLGQLSKLGSMLSAEEQVRANRFRFEKHRNRYIAARAVLRSLLAAYLEIDATAVQLSYNAHGKPDLADPADDLRFNLAHSSVLALYGITRGRNIGIDVERIRPELAAEDIARRFFAPEEVAALSLLPEELRMKAFFKCWTRKEAFVKARGLGLSMPLDHFVVSLHPGETPALLSVKDDEQMPSRWAICELDPEEGYAAALAVEEKNFELKCWNYGIY